MVNHRLLLRQLKKLGLSFDSLPDSQECWQLFLQRISEAYAEADKSRKLSQNSLDVLSEEMMRRCLSVQKEEEKKLSNLFYSAGKTMQEVLLPPFQHSFDSLQMAHFHQPALQMGGDWFGVFPSDNSKYISLIQIDVTGHGIPAAIATGVLAGAIFGEYKGKKGKSLDDEWLKGLAEITNSVLFEHGHQSKLFGTATFCGFDLVKNQLTIIHCGNPPLFHLSGERCRVVHGLSSPLGLKAELNFLEARLDLKAGDRFLLTTDGLIENLFASKGRNELELIKKEIETNRHRTPKDFREHLLYEWKLEWNGKVQPDDLSFSIVDWEG